MQPDVGGGGRPGSVERDAGPREDAFHPAGDLLVDLVDHSQAGVASGVGAVAGAAMRSPHIGKTFVCWRLLGGTLLSAKSSVYAPAPPPNTFSSRAPIRWTIAPQMPRFSVCPDSCSTRYASVALPLVRKAMLPMLYPVEPELRLPLPASPPTRNAVPVFAE